jgi:hypothetical protein
MRASSLPLVAAVATALGFAPLDSFAQGTSAAGLLGCRAIKDNLDRLTCFDREAANFGSDSTVAGAPAANPPSNIALARSAVIRLLKDQSSAQFDTLRETVAADGSTGVCGQVNAKNSMGGYAGSKLFVYDVSKKAVIVLDTGATILDVPPVLANAMLRDGLRLYEKYCETKKTAAPAAKKQGPSKGSTPPN